MNKVVEAIQSNQKPKLLQVANEGFTPEPAAHAEIITGHFRKMFPKEDMDTLPTTPSHQMTPPFNKDEISQAVKILKKNKSAGGDYLQAEQLKYEPDIVFQSTAGIFIFNTKKTTEVKDDILLQLQKPGKAKGPACYLCPIILLSSVNALHSTMMS